MAAQQVERGLFRCCAASADPIPPVAYRARSTELGVGAEQATVRGHVEQALAKFDAPGIARHALLLLNQHRHTAIDFGG